MLSKINQRKTKTVWYHLYIEPKKATSTERVEWWSQGAENGTNGEVFIKEYKFPVGRWVSSMTIVNNTAYNILESC